MPKVATEEPQLRELGITAVFARAKDAAVRFKKMAHTIAGDSKTDRHDFIRVSLLSKNRSAPYYGFVVAHEHSAPTKTKTARSAALHMHLMRRPSDTPPEELVKLRKRGVTLEWLRGELLGLTPTEVEAETRIFFPRRPENRVHSLVSVPLRHGDRTLVLCGAEYRDSAANSDVTAFRWREKSNGGLEVWLSYVVPWEDVLSEDPWTAETQRSTRFTLELF